MTCGITILFVIAEESTAAKEFRLNKRGQERPNSYKSKVKRMKQKYTEDPEPFAGNSI